MKKPTKIVVDDKLEITDIMALQIVFNTLKDTGEPYEAVTIYDSAGGVQTYPLSRVRMEG